MTFNAQKISEAFRVTLFEANLAILVVRGRVTEDKFPLVFRRRFPKTCEWLEQCYHKPLRVEVKLLMLDELLDTCGVEPISDERFHVDRYHGSIVASYLNTGDTYATTILRDHIDYVWRMTSYGDFIESLDERVEQSDEAC